MRKKCVCIDTFLDFNVGMIYEYQISHIKHKEEKFKSIVEVFYKFDTDFGNGFEGSHSFVIPDFNLFFSIDEYRNLKIDQIINPS